MLRVHREWKYYQNIFQYQKQTGLFLLSLRGTMISFLVDGLMMEEENIAEEYW
mgnify:CR=1 FL=1